MLLRYRKAILISLVLIGIPIMAFIFQYLYSLGVEVGKNWRILYENGLFS